MSKPEPPAIGQPSINLDPARKRWRLNRAGIVNVYQYENEVLHFGGGRLLLRGVNGSGKSTAMNMLLPFLLTAQQRRIDAAGEQSRILQSWMLDGRDDSQPIGYLWIEFQWQQEFLVCGCGIKANRNSKTVTTWWFITSKRPGIDFQLIENRHPLTLEGLRTAIDGDEVFTDDKRPEYRRRIEQLLFNSAPIDQHIKLINMVRNPRVGDRIDVDLPVYLVEALPQLSEQALVEAAQPLDDLEEHRRSVAEMSRTLEAVKGILSVYRAYCISDLKKRVSEGRDRLQVKHRCARDEKRRQQEAETTATEVRQKENQIVALEEQAKGLRIKITALKDSPIYKDGQQLDDLRKLVDHLRQKVGEGDERVSDRTKLLERAANEVREESIACQNRRDELNDCLASASQLGSELRIAHRPPGPVGWDEVSLSDSGLSEPGQIDIAPIRQQIKAAVGSIAQRRLDFEEVEQTLGETEAAETRLRQIENDVEEAAKATQIASDRLSDRERRLADTTRAWSKQAELWFSELHPLTQEAGIDLSPYALIPETGAAIQLTEPEPTPEAKRAILLDAASALIEHLQRSEQEINFELDAEQAAEQEAQLLVDELARRREPNPPRLGWQGTGQYCLADLIDFAPNLDEVERAGIEAAMESCGLLSARLADGAFELASGDLIALVSGGVPSPLSEFLTVAVPEHLLGMVDDGLVIKLLESISCDLSSGTNTAISADGTFRVGALSGRHHKDKAEHIGAPARRAALERDRQEATTRLHEAQASVKRSREGLKACQSALTEAWNRRALVPDLSEVIELRAEVKASIQFVEDAEIKQAEAAEQFRDVERLATRANDDLHSKATTLALPTTRAGLIETNSKLDEMVSTLDRGGNQLNALSQSIAIWCRAVEHWQDASRMLAEESRDLDRDKSKHSGEQARLTTLEDSIGTEYAEILDACRRSEAELTGIGEGLPKIRGEKEDKIRLEAEARTAVANAAEKRAQAEKACEASRKTLAMALEAPGYLSAISSQDQDILEIPVTHSEGSDGLMEIIEAIDRLLASLSTSPDTTAHYHPGPDTSETALNTATDPDSVRRSLRQRQDSLGEGWDAKDLQPDPAGPLIVEVYGPSGRGPLAESVQAVSQKHQELDGLLTSKQNTALRELLQGTIAKEIAEKVSNAARLIERMNQHLGNVTTAHEVGVTLRWRRSRELDPDTVRLVDLLSKVPDLRTDDEEQELRLALSTRLRQAQVEQPDVAFRQLIADTLDYKRWHELAVIVQRADMPDSKLTRKTPLSEGEKKLITYLPLFAAVAASCDALCDQGYQSRETAPDVCRFVLLDDAFAKVSEDNHAALFGLLVDLDLDFIATSERLWGTHRRVPQLSITEVIRDAKRQSILLEHYRWDGAVLERTAT